MEWSADTTEEANPAGISYPFRYDLPLHDVFAALSSSLAMRVPLSGAALFRVDDAFELTAAAAWNDSEPGAPHCPLPDHAALTAWFSPRKGARLTSLIEKTNTLCAEIPSTDFPLPWRPGPCCAVLLPFGGKPAGIALFRRAEGHPCWKPGEMETLASLALPLGIFLAGQDFCAEQTLRNRVLNAALDQAKVCIYVTNPRTDEILYMNQTMRENFNLENPEGKICWQVLQKGFERRCDFCPIPLLEKNSVSYPLYHWEEHNTLTGRLFKNYDCLMPWIDGSIAHLQQSIDVTDYQHLWEASRRDELTMLPNRRAGMTKLDAELERVVTDDIPLSVALVDMNLLKHINDNHSHAEGDRALRLTAEVLREGLGGSGFCFRLSGDEFVAIFPGEGHHAAALRMEEIRAELNRRWPAEGLPCAVDFCFGVAEASPGVRISAAEVMARADERMYERKKQLHILEARRRPTVSASPRDECHACDPRMLYQALARSTDSYLFVSDVETGTFRYSRAMVEEFGLPGEVLENAAAVWEAHIHPDDKANFLEANQIVMDGRADYHCVEYRARNRRGEWVWVRCRGALERDSDGKPGLFAGFITNLGQKNKIDPITGLFNKIRMKEDMEPLLRESRLHPLQFMLLGIDSFKNVNNLYGKHFGDETLRIVAQRIQSLLPPHASLYRLDGDEFGVVIRGCRDEARAVYRTLAEAFRHQQEYDGKKFFCTLSAGTASCPDDAKDYESLLHCADNALDAAKQGGKNRQVFFLPEQSEVQRRSLELTELLRESVERDFENFSLAYQPQVTSDGTRVIGAEALARWRCDKYGKVSPGEFVPLLEQSGLIVPFGRWVFQRAAEQCREWTAIRPDFEVSINLSYIQVTSDDMLPFIERILKRLALSPRNIVVEFTESCVMQGNVQTVFDSLRAMGVRIAMDDFGTGYSSLGMLKNLPADVVKIDRTFVRDILHSRFDETFIRFVVELCHHVNIKVCLEGVEHPDEHRLVKNMGLDSVQGYLFGRPVDPVSFTHTFLAKGPKTY